MGQRTAILVKRHFEDGTCDVSLYHKQWGFGKIMPMMLMQEDMRICYKPVKFEEEFYNTGMKGGYFDFHDFVSHESAYIVNGKNVEDEEDKTDYNAFDVFAKAQAKQLFEMTDNNNGGMILELWEKGEHDKDYHGKEFVSDYAITRAEIAFVPGPEDDRDGQFVKLMTAREYMEQWKDVCPEIFIKLFEEYLDFAGFKQRKKWHVVKD